MSTARATVALLVSASTVPWLLGRAAEPAAGALHGGGATVRFQNRENAPIGEAVLRSTPNGIVATVTLHDLPAGEHGFHIHETGKCLPPFESAGGHFDPTGRPHGFAAEGGPHVGDLPNLVVPASGRVSFQIFVPEATLDEGGPATLLDADGSAFVVHAGADDHHTDPAGHSGGRIACGIVVSTEEKR